MTKITTKLLIGVAGAKGKLNVVNGLVEHLPSIMNKYKINTRLRMVHFLAQLAHESDHFRTLEEYASGSAYEGRRDLGNIHRGDGRRFKGRGAIQLTGRSNYREMGKRLGIDLEGKPELAATPKVSSEVAAIYWTSRGLNELADADNGKQITRKINGGYNGLTDRLNKIARAKKFITGPLEIDTPAPAPLVAATTPAKPKKVAAANVVPINIASLDTSHIDLTDEEKKKVLKELLSVNT
jgi:predicted chitinase